MSSINHLKDSALNILLGETFSQVRQDAKEEYEILCRENVALNGQPANYFMYNGVVYPQKWENNGRVVPPLRVKVLNLHYTLIKDLLKINNQEAEAGYEYVKNFFSAVLSASFNGIVLDELLPGILVNKLRSELSPGEFMHINLGTAKRTTLYKDGFPQASNDSLRETIAETRENIEKIREHYGDSAKTLRMLLMDKLLLE